MNVELTVVIDCCCKECGTLHIKRKTLVFQDGILVIVRDADDNDSTSCS
jgi:hypothetical protein